MFVLLAWIIVIFILYLEAVHLALYALALCGKMLTLIISLWCHWIANYVIVFTACMMHSHIWMIIGGNTLYGRLDLMQLTGLAYEYPLG